MKTSKDSEEQRTSVFQTCMEELVAAFGRGPVIPDAMMRAYWSVIGCYDCDRIREGFAGALAKEIFWPPPAKILQHIRQRPEDVYPELDK